MLLLRDHAKARYCFPLNQFSSASEQASVLFQAWFQIQVLAMASIGCVLIFGLLLHFCQVENLKDLGLCVFIATSLAAHF